jgi:DNA-binding MarR family transcriptional regulator
MHSYQAMFTSKSSLTVALFLAKASERGGLDRLSIADLSKQVGLSRPTLHMVLSSFQSRGLLALHQDCVDKRFKHIVLRPEFYAAARRELHVFLANQAGGYPNDSDTSENH